MVTLVEVSELEARSHQEHLPHVFHHRRDGASCEVKLLCGVDGCRVKKLVIHFS